MHTDNLTDAADAAEFSEEITGAGAESRGLVLSAAPVANTIVTGVSWFASVCICWYGVDGGANGVDGAEDPGALELDEADGAEEPDSTATHNISLKKG